MNARFEVVSWFLVLGIIVTATSNSQFHSLEVAGHLVGNGRISS